MSIINPANRPVSISTDSAAHPANSPAGLMNSNSISISDVIRHVTEMISTVTPLQDYVAVNPYVGLASRRFLDARKSMQSFSDCELLMPLSYFARQFQRQRFEVKHIEAALHEIAANHPIPEWDEQTIASELQATNVSQNTFEPIQSPNAERRYWTMAELARQTVIAQARQSADWCDAIVDEVGKHCAAHFDGGQATWYSPFRGQSLYSAWKTAAGVDRNLETLGLSGVRDVVKSLPDSPDEAIQHCLELLQVPDSQWPSFLLCQAFTIPGWSAWAKHQDSVSDSEAPTNLRAVLAMRLAYDVAVARHHDLQPEWDVTPRWNSVPDSAIDDDSLLRNVLLRAAEIGHLETIMQQLNVSPKPATTGNIQSLAQVAFCIDVRSERYRRLLETAHEDVETLGFAGFFAMPIEYVRAGNDNGVGQVPVLLQPHFNVYEGMDRSGKSAANMSDVEAKHVRDLVRKRSWKSAWTKFRMSAVGCFSFVETTGLFFSLSLLQRSLGWTKEPKASVTDDTCRLGPTMRGLDEQGIGVSEQADLAEGMLRGMSLTKDFAKLIVFAGHGSQTENNPLAAGLECGACGGHSGEPNARFAAMLLNNAGVRSELANRGIVIPDETHFLGALHNTTTDEVELFDTREVPESRKDDVQELRDALLIAGQATRIERDADNARADEEAFRRSSEWSEVRPEWGLAGNAAFIVGPRSLTKSACLDGRVFLHQYEEDADPSHAVLEAIMTAPLVVAHMINMQYYASTVDNHNFGSGNKTIHNVVGKFGILSGNSGDLQTGLPLQSLHDGHDHQHQPLRLQSIFVAKRSAIDSVVEKHELLQNLLANGWLHLIAIENSISYRLAEDGSWHEVSAGTPATLASTAMP